MWEILFIALQELWIKCLLWFYIQCHKKFSNKFEFDNVTSPSRLCWFLHTVLPLLNPKVRVETVNEWHLSSRNKEIWRVGSALLFCHGVSGQHSWRTLLSAFWLKSRIVYYSWWTFSIRSSMFCFPFLFLTILVQRKKKRNTMNHSRKIYLWIIHK